MLVNLNNGFINFNNTVFEGKVGTLNLINSSIENFKDDLVFNGNFKFTIKSENEFYRLFQISKNERKKINNFYFDVEINFPRWETQIKTIRLSTL